jgi:hypothetical protein
MDDVQLALLGAPAVPATGGLAAQIDGVYVPLDKCDWVLWGPCGCPFGVTVASYAPAEDDAWNAFYDCKREIAKAQRRGNRLELMTHERYSREVCPRMTVRCPHAEVAK